MNPDVPLLVVCRKLAAAGWPQGDCPRWWRSAGDPDEKAELAGFDCVSEDNPEDEYVAAPSIGRLFAFCRERGWRAEIDMRFDGVSVVRITTGTWSNLCAVDDGPANALAEAAAAAMAAERKGV